MPRTKKITPTDKVEVINDKLTDNKQIVAIKNSVVKQTADIDSFLIKRQEFIQKVSVICVEGKDYHIIQGKKSLAKGGAEKIASIFQWNSTFSKDTESLEMLGQEVGLVVLKCTLAKGNKFVGEGRGVATLKKNAGDPNKTLKMAQKSAFIDAVLRTSGLSDFFTQDLEDMNVADIGKPQINSYPPTEKQHDFIKVLMEQKGVDEVWVMEQSFTALKDLTGGRTGTATELIELLKAYIPIESRTVQGEGMDSTEKVIERLSGPAEMAIADLEASKDKAEAQEILNKIEAARLQGRFSAYDWSAIVTIAKRVASKFNS